MKSVKDKYELVEFYVYFKLTNISPVWSCHNKYVKGNFLSNTKQMRFMLQSN
jgi:hypothetical protein